MKTSLNKIAIAIGTRLAKELHALFSIDLLNMDLNYNVLCSKDIDYYIWDWKDGLTKIDNIMYRALRYHNVSAKLYFIIQADITQY